MLRKHDPELLATNLNGTFYRFCSCDKCNSERGWESGNLKEEVEDIFKCTLVVLGFCLLTGLAALESGSGFGNWKHVASCLTFAIGSGVFFMSFVIVIRIWDNHEYQYRRAIRKRNRRVNKRRK